MQAYLTDAPTSFSQMCSGMFYMISYIQELCEL